MQARSRICSGFRAALSADLLGQRQDAASHPVAVENADMRLTLQVNGFDKHSDKLAENFEVPLEAAEDLRELFEGLPEVSLMSSRFRPWSSWRRFRDGVQRSI